MGVVHSLEVVSEAEAPVREEQEEWWAGSLEEKLLCSVCAWHLTLFVF